jgi:hypothetical protein
VDQPLWGTPVPNRQRPTVHEDAATSLAEALTVFHDDEERATRIHYLVDEAFPPDPSGRRVQDPDEAKRAVRALVPHVADAEFESRWAAIVHAARWQSAPEYTDALREACSDERSEQVRSLAAADRAATHPAGGTHRVLGPPATA